MRSHRSFLGLGAWLLQVNEMVNKGKKNASTVWFHANIREYSQYPFMKLLIPALNAFILKEHGLLPIQVHLQGLDIMQYQRSPLSANWKTPLAH